MIAAGDIVQCKTGSKGRGTVQEKAFDTWNRDWYCQVLWAASGVTEKVVLQSIEKVEPDETETRVVDHDAVRDSDVPGGDAARVGSVQLVRMGRGDGAGSADPAGDRLVRLQASTHPVHSVQGPAAG